MYRVRDAATKYIAFTYETDLTEKAAMLADNEFWLRQQIALGRKVYSVGIDIKAAIRSEFYEMELRVCKELGVKIHYLKGF
jgi:hypothetical protein